jgi:HEPN domain-containing protein
MQPQSEPIRLARQWLEKAQQDLAGAELMASSTGLLDLVAFHCQQAVEKALKGFLAFYDEPFRRTQNLVELLQQCAQFDQELAGFEDGARALSPFAIDLRYPGVTGVGPDQAAAALSIARDLVDFVRARITEAT